jgi:lipooligosaccharide transport system permease protein
VSPISGTGLSATQGLFRQFDYWSMVYRRTWRGTFATSFLSPVLYVVAMGVVLGGLVPGNPETLEGATSYLAFVVPGLIVGHAMLMAVGEASYPVLDMLRWSRMYYSKLATPLTVADVVAGHLAFILVRVSVSSGIFVAVAALLGVFETVWGALLIGTVQCLVALTFGAWVYGISVRIRNDEALMVLYRVGIFPMFLASGVFFPVANLGSVPEALARFTPLWHAVDLSRMLAVDQVELSKALLHVGVLLVLALTGWWWAVSGLAKRVAL